MTPPFGIVKGFPPLMDVGMEIVAPKFHKKKVRFTPKFTVFRKFGEKMWVSRAVKICARTFWRRLKYGFCLG